MLLALDLEAAINAACRKKEREISPPEMVEAVKKRTTMPGMVVMEASQKVERGRPAIEGLAIRNVANKGYWKRDMAKVVVEVKRGMVCRRLGRNVETGVVERAIVGSLCTFVSQEDDSSRVDNPCI